MDFKYCLLVFLLITIHEHQCQANDHEISLKKAVNYESDEEINNYNDDNPYKHSMKATRQIPKSIGYIDVFIRNPSKKSKNSKPKRFRFPVVEYARDRSPFFVGLISYIPWLPIYVDRLTKHTIIYSATKGIFIVPAVMTAHTKLFSLAELIASNYASFKSDGSQPQPGIDIAPLVKPGKVVGPGIPTIDSTGDFDGPVKTAFSSFPDRIRRQKSNKHRLNFIKENKKTKPIIKVNN